MSDLFLIFIVSTHASKIYLASHSQLSHEITEDIQDAEKYKEEIETFMDMEVKHFQNLNQLSHFIKSNQE